MKKPLLYAATALMAMTGACPSYGALPADGYYRVQNAYTKRYAYLLDNKGSIDEHTTTVDVGALKLYADITDLNTDPANVFYISHHTDNKYAYDIAGQGTSVYTFLDHYVEIYDDRPYDGKDTYMICGVTSRLSKYIGDIWTEPENEGLASSEAKGDDRKWYFDSITADTDQYFGVRPTFEAGGKYYQPLFAGFPFSAYSSGIKFYVVTDLDPRGAAIIKEVKGTIPAGTPVIVECSAEDASNNRLNVGGTSTADTESVKGNMMRGVYFENYSRGNHRNLTEFNKKTMRVLGVKDGRVAFVEGDMEYVARNQAYLQLQNEDQCKTKDFVVMTQEEYDEVFGAVAVIPVSSVVDVYSLDGRLIKSGVSKDEVKSLGKGLYLLRSEGVTEKHIVR